MDIEKKELSPFATAWMDLDVIMLSEISQSEKDNVIWSQLYVESNEQNKLMKKIEIEAWTHGTDWQLSEGRVEGGTRWKVKGLAKEHMYHP